MPVDTILNALRDTRAGTVALMHRPRHMLGYAGLQYLWPKRQRRGTISSGLCPPATPL